MTHRDDYRHPEVAFCGEENDPNYNIMKISKDPLKRSIVQRGIVAARQLVEGIAIEEVAKRCTLSQELVLQVLVNTIFEEQKQLAEQLAVVQRLYQTLVDQLQAGVVYQNLCEKNVGSTGTSISRSITRSATLKLKVPLIS